VAPPYPRNPACQMRRRAVPWLGIRLGSPFRRTTHYRLWPTHSWGQGRWQAADPVAWTGRPEPSLCFLLGRTELRPSMSWRDRPGTGSVG
jgi:hypothetical protein